MSVGVCVLNSFSYKDIQMGLESHLMNSFNLIYLFKDLMSKYSSILKYWGLGFNIWTGVEEQSLGERGSGIQPVELRACVHVCVCVCDLCVSHSFFSYTVLQLASLT